jgi:hypothetical protein
MKCKQAVLNLFVSNLLLALVVVVAGCTGGSGGGSGGGHSGGGGSDFVISSVILTPPNPSVGQPFTASVVVQNLGNGTGNPSNLTVWLDQPNVQSCGAVGDQSSTNLVTIGIGQTTGHTFSMVAPKTSPPWTFRAFVNSECAGTEVDTSNNQYSRSYGTPEGLPDFAISSIVLSPPNPSTGQTFTATVTVTNLGGAGGVLGYLDVWVDQPATQSCHSVGNHFVSLGLLGAGAAFSQTFTNLTAPTIPAAPSWTFRAFVDSECATTEINKDNNQVTQLYPFTPAELTTTDQLSLFWFSPHYADYYQLTGAAGSTTIEMASFFDTYLLLYDSSWTLLTWDDDSGFGLNSRIVYPLVSGQTYYIEATTYSSAVTGAYNLTTSQGTLTSVVRP